MATKRYSPLDDPPSASSDDDETDDEQETLTQNPIDQSSSSTSEEEEEEEDDDDDDEEESEEESEEETEAPEPIKYSLENPQFQNPNLKQSELLSEEAIESESEEETPPPTKIVIKKPITVTPPSSSAYEIDSPTASDFAIKPSKKIKPERTPVSKRPFSGLETKGNKKVRVLNGDVDEEKKSVNKRVWSVDDEIMLLQGFIDYQMEIGRSPLSDMDGFYQFTMNSLPEYASKSQLYEKVRRLKKKFRVNSEKAGLNGEEPVFAKPHERKLYELSSKIWGVGGCESVSASAGAGGGSIAKGKVRVPKVKAKVEVKEKDMEEEKVSKVEEFETLYPYWNAGLTSEVSSALRFPAGVVNLVKENLSVIGEAKAKEMNEKWEAIFENEAVLRKRRIALLSSIGGVETA